MNGSADSGVQGPLAALRRLARAKGRDREERCDLCNVRLASEHRHLLELGRRRIHCSCDPCALSFENVIGGRFKAIPRDARRLPDFHMEDAQWDGLAIPISLAFIFFSTPEDKMTALYPSPAGVTESLLPLSEWQALVSDNPPLQHLEPDVEALLVNRVGATREYFIAPIDVCFQLAGLLRLHWRGLSGGEAVWREIGEFFARLRNNSKLETDAEIHAPLRQEPSHA